jgi:serine/threonine protein kinase
MPVATTPLPVDLVGLVVDNGRSQFVELLGVGAYGSVYLAYDLLSPPNYPVYFAAKVMVKAPPKSRQRAFQRREIDLHTNASPHPNVVTVHKVLDEQGYYILIMDYYPDGDLFSMVTDNQFYLGKDDLTKSVFLQIIDAVIYCHSLGIYHRDIKPENILCLDGGRTVALADFGLATTDELSNDFGAGSSYYMSPGSYLIFPFLFISLILLFPQNASTNPLPKFLPTPRNQTTSGH